jgi:hypothetical protein
MRSTRACSRAPSVSVSAGGAWNCAAAARRISSRHALADHRQRQVQLRAAADMLPALTMRAKAARAGRSTIRWLLFGNGKYLSPERGYFCVAGSYYSLIDHLTIAEGEMMKLPNEPASGARRQFLGQAGTLPPPGCCRLRLEHKRLRHRRRPPVSGRATRGW